MSAKVDSFSHPRARQAASSLKRERQFLGVLHVFSYPSGLIREVLVSVLQASIKLLSVPFSPCFPFIHCHLQRFSWQFALSLIPLNSLPLPSRLTPPSFARTQHGHCQSICELENHLPSQQCELLSPDFTFNWLLFFFFHLGQLKTTFYSSAFPGLAALQELSASHDSRFPNAIESQDGGLACLPVPCHLAEVRGCHLLLLWWGGLVHTCHFSAQNICCLYKHTHCFPSM